MAAPFLVNSKMRLARCLPSSFFVLWLVASSARLSEAYSDASAGSSSSGLGQPPGGAASTLIGQASNNEQPSTVVDPTTAVGAPADPLNNVGNHQEDFEGALTSPELTPSQPSLVAPAGVHHPAESEAVSAVGVATGTTAVTTTRTTTSSSANPSSLLLRNLRLPRLQDVKIHPRLTNLADRTVPAVVLLSILFGVAKKGGEFGLRCLLLAITPGLFNEAVSVATHSLSKQGAVTFSNRWCWFVAYSLLATVPLVAPTNVKAEQLRFAGYATSLLCWVGWILRLNSKNDVNSSLDGSSTSDGEDSRFASAWGEISTYHMAALVSILPIHSLMAILRAERMDWALYACLLVICNDTFAYLVGHFIGKHPLLPVISPKKTLEGWAGGFLFTTLVSPLLWKQLFQQKPYTAHSLHVALFGSVIAPFGGYLASTAKRAFGKKDFGTLLGSHGGLMDRLDCQLITAPYLYLFLSAVGEM